MITTEQTRASEPARVMSAPPIGAPTSQPERRILRWPEVYERVKKSRAQVWRDIKAGKFPAPVSLGTNSIGWFSDEIEGHLATLARVNYAPTAA